MNEILGKIVESFRASGYEKTTIYFEQENVAKEEVFDTTARVVTRPHPLPVAKNITWTNTNPVYNTPPLKHVTLNDIQIFWEEWPAPHVKKNKGKTDLIIQKDAEICAAFENFYAITGHFPFQNTDYTLQVTFFAGLIEHEALEQFRRGDNQKLNKFLSVRFNDGRGIQTRSDAHAFYWKIQYKGEEQTSFISLLQHIYNCSYLDALATSANILGMSFENTFAVHKGEQHATEHSGKSIEEDWLPRCFEISLDSKQLQVTLVHTVEITGFIGQNISGMAIYRYGNETMNFPFSTAYRKLTLGKHKAPAHFYNQSKINSLPDATVLLCQNIHDAVILEKIFKNASNIVVSCHYGHDLEPLPWNYFVNRTVIIICTVCQESYARAEAYKNKLEGIKVKSFSIFPFPIFSNITFDDIKNTVEVRSKLEQELFKKAIYLKDATSEYLLQNHIKTKALIYDGFKEWGQDFGIFVRKEATQLKQSDINPTFALSKSKSSQIRTFGDVNLSHIFSFHGLALICGKKGTAKTFLLMSIFRALCSGEPFLGIKGIGTGETIINYDTESLPDDFSSRLQQLNLEKFMDNKLHCIVKSSMEERNPFYSFSIDDNKSQEIMESYARNNNAKSIGIDNLTTSMADGKENTIYTPNFSKNTLDWGKRLNQHGIGLILLHHLHENCADSIRGTIRGSQELFIRSHTILVLIGAEEVLASKKKYPEIIIDRCQKKGATIGIYFKACKLAGILERTILWAHLPYNSSDWELLAHTDMDGNELEESLCTVIDNSEGAQEKIQAPMISNIDVVSPLTYENLTCDEKKIVNFLHETSQASTSEIATAMDFSESKTRPLLKQLIDKGIIKDEGKGRAHKYLV